MKFYTWLLFATLLAYSRTEAPKYVCPESIQCTYKFRPKNEYIIRSDQVTYKYNGAVFSITCSIDTIANFSILPKLLEKEFPESIFIKNCGSLDFPILKLLNDINVGDNFTKLHMINENEIVGIEKEHFENLTKVKELKIEEKSNLNLTEDFFAELLNLEKINIKAKSLNAQDGVFSSMPKLTSLKLITTEPENLSTDLFMNCEHLRELILSDSIFKNINSIQFNGLNSLEALYMDNSGLQNSGLNLLQMSSLPKLKKLDISKNNFSSLPENLLKGFPELNFFSMSRNIAAIKTIPNGFFSNLVHLEQISMSQSNIYNLETGVFLNSPNIKFVFMSQNLIKVIPTDLFKDQKLLEIIDLSHNRLYKFESFNIEFVRDLILKKNRITSLSLTNVRWQKTINSYQSRTITNIKNLDMSSNKISKINLNMLYTIKGIDTIDLSNNRITSIETPIKFTHENNLIIEVLKVIMENNPIDCDCRHLNLIRFFKMSPKLSSMLGGNVCFSPQNLKERIMRSLNECDLRCKVESCPKSCQCSLQACNNANIVKCTLQNASLPLLLSGRNIELNLENSSLISLSSLRINGTSFAKIKKMFLANNNISELAVSDIPDNISLLDLRNNSISYVSDQVVKKLNSSHLTNISISGNPIVCDCKNEAFLTYLRESSSIVSDMKEVACSNQKLLLRLVDIKLLCGTSDMLFYTEMTLMITAIILLILTALYFKYQMEVKVWLFAKGWFISWITEEEVDKDKVFDAFLAWSHKDDDFVLNTFLPKLEEGPNPFKICVHHRDWNVGEYITLQINRTIMESRRTIVILSPNFLTSVWGIYEFRLAHCLALEEGRNRVIVVCYGDLGPRDKMDKDLQAYLATKTYLEWGDPLFWKKLMYALPHPTPNRTIEKTVIYRSGLVEFRRNN